MTHVKIAITPKRTMAKPVQLLIAAIPPAPPEANVPVVAPELRENPPPLEPPLTEELNADISYLS